MGLDAFLLASLLLGLASAASAADASSCALATSGYSAFFGTKASGAKFVDHSPLMKQGSIKSVSLFFSKSAGCLRGAKVVIDTPTPTPGVIGTAVNTSEVALKLSQDEYVTRVEHKTSKQCIQYIKLFTSKGRSAFAGLPDAPATLVKLSPPSKGRLVAIRGFQSINGTKAGALQQLQFVWGVQKCPGDSSAPEIPVAASALRTAAPANSTTDEDEPKAPAASSPEPAPASSSSSGNSSSSSSSSKKNAATTSGSSSSSSAPASSKSKSPKSPSSSSSPASAAAVAPVPAPAPAAPAKNTDPAACPAMLDMCNEKAAMNQFTYCVWNAPFTKSACRGGCCVSSGKCASSSCTISGMGRDVSNMICYGTNSGYGFGGSNQCAGLACKLATPGCTTDAFGGNCVGTVTAFKPKEEVHPESLKYIGAACLDATPSDTTLDASGNPVDFDGIYMGKLWTICDCSDSESQGGMPDLATNLLNLTTTGLSNITKNDVLLAMSQLLPKINLSDALGGDDGADASTQLFPSFTDFFKLPSLPTITMPEFLGGASSSNGSLPAVQMPSLSSLLEQLSLKSAAGTGASSPAPGDSAASGTSSTAPTTSKGSSNGLSGIKNLLSKFLPSIQVIQTSSPAPASSTTSGSDAATTKAAADPATPALAPALAAPAPAARIAATPASTAASAMPAPANVAAPTVPAASVTPAAEGPATTPAVTAAAAAVPAPAAAAAPAEQAPVASGAPAEKKKADGSSSSSSSSSGDVAMLGEIGW